jgi:hypothetical protein
LPRAHKEASVSGCTVRNMILRRCRTRLPATARRRLPVGGCGLRQRFDEDEERCEAAVTKPAPRKAEVSLQARIPARSIDQIPDSRPRRGIMSVMGTSDRDDRSGALELLR